MRRLTLWSGRSKWGLTNLVVYIQYRVGVNVRAMFGGHNRKCGNSDLWASIESRSMTDSYIVFE